MTSGLLAFIEKTNQESGFAESAIEEGRSAPVIEG